MAHTPAPWRMEEDENGDTWIRIPGHDLHICNAEGSCRECYANVRLIAAAPDLLAALKRIADWQEIVAEYGSAGAQQQIREIAHAAVAKAKLS